MEAAPDQHKALIDAVNRRKYKLDKFRSGYNIPHITEIKVYSSRIKKEILPYLARDLGCSSQGNGYYLSEDEINLENKILETKNSIGRLNKLKNNKIKLNELKKDISDLNKLLKSCRKKSSNWGNLSAVFKKKSTGKDNSFFNNKLLETGKFFMQFIGKKFKIEPVPIAEGKVDLFVEGWYYILPLGMAHDIERFENEEEL